MEQNKYSAGGVLINSNNQIYLVKKISRNEWGIPKGTVEQDEEVIDTAFRELREETGFKEIELFYKNPINITHYRFIDKETGKENNKYVTYFIFKTNESIPETTPFIEKEGLEGSWFDYKAALNILTFEESKETLIYAWRIISNQKIELFLLGGNGIKNLDWIKEVSKSFTKNFPDNSIIYYNHWTHIEKLSLDIDYEAKNFAEKVANQNNFQVFAKSAGIMTTLKAIRDYELKPKNCVFVGFPITFLNEFMPEIKSYLENINFSVTFFQNSKDPYSGYTEVKVMLDQINNPNIKIIEEIGDTHDYNNLELYLNSLNTLTV